MLRGVWNHYMIILLSQGGASSNVFRYSDEQSLSFFPESVFVNPVGVASFRNFGLRILDLLKGWDGKSLNSWMNLKQYIFPADRGPFDGMGNPVTLRYPGGPDSSMVEHLVQFQKGLGSSPGPVTFHAAIPFYEAKRGNAVIFRVSEWIRSTKPTLLVLLESNEGVWQIMQQCWVDDTSSYERFKSDRWGYGRWW